MLRAARQVNFEAEEEGDDIDSDKDNSDNDDELAEFIDDKVIPYQEYVPPNPYLERSLQLPRGLQKVIRVSCLI